MLPISNLLLDQICLSIIEKMPKYLQDYKLCCKIMYATGCRGSESFNLSRWRLESSVLYTLRPQKFNDLRLFYEFEMPEDFKIYFEENQVLIGNCNYRKLQYCINQIIHSYGIFVKEKDSVCHLFRHNYVKKLVDAGTANEVIKEKLGERTMRSTEQYIYSQISSRYQIIL